MTKRATKAQVKAAYNRLARESRKLEKARTMVIRWQSAVETAEEDKTRALDNLSRVESKGFE